MKKKQLEEMIRKIINEEDEFVGRTANNFKYHLIHFEDSIEEAAKHAMGLYELLEQDESPAGKKLFQIIEDDIVGPVGTALNELDRRRGLLERFISYLKSKDANRNVKL